MTPDAAADRPNIVLVTCDSLRADHCGFMGYDRDTTPALDRLARDGLAFTDAVAPGPSTPESMPAVFTGHYPVADEAAGEPEALDLVDRRARLVSHMGSRDTLAERLSRRGYDTAGFTPNPYTSGQFGFDAGFDRFEDFADGSRGALYDRAFEGFLAGSTPASLVRIATNVWRREEVFKPWETFYDDLVEWTGSATEPYFLWVLLMDAHNPYLTSDEFRTQSRAASLHANYRFWRESHETPFSPVVHDRLVTAYDDAVRYADAFLDRLHRDLTDRGDDPVFVVHADHGEAFGEHGRYGHEPYLHEENIHVPLVVAGGDIESRRVDDPVSLRRLSDVVVSLAAPDPSPTGDGPTDRAVTAAGAGAATVLSHTRQGGLTAVRGRRLKCVESADGRTFYRLDPSGETRLDTDGAAPASAGATWDGEDVARFCREYRDALSRFRRTECEKRAIDAAARVVRECRPEGRGDRR